MERVKNTIVAADHANMVRIAGGTFRMGSDSHYPEEAPAHQVEIDSFCIDRLPVTNRQFAAFVAATGYRTVAERALDASHYPALGPAQLQPGSMVFRPPREPVDLRNIANWWAWKSGAYWRHPEGQGSSVAARLDHPVVQVAFEDAEAYALWAGKALPTEAEWEFAARGGLEGAAYAWGETLEPDGRRMAHTWRGEFPWRNLHPNGLQRTAPVGRYPANGYGLFDMIGNVWEWTIDWFAPTAPSLMPTTPVARRSIRVAPRLRQVMIHRSPTCAYRARWSRADPSCVRPATAVAMSRQRGMRR